MEIILSSIKKQKELLFILIILALSFCLVFLGLDAHDSPYHLLHYKLRLIDFKVLFSNLFGIWIVDFATHINESHNTMILLRMVNWVLIFFPFIWLIFFHHKFLRDNWLFVSALVVVGMPTNWNTLCWDSWNRFYWFIIVIYLNWISINKLNNFLAIILLFLLLIIGIGVKVSNILLIIIIPIFFYLRRFEINDKFVRLFLLMLLLLGSFFLIGRVPKINFLEFFSVNEYLSEVYHKSHNLDYLILTNLKQLLIFVFIKVTVILITKKNSFETLQGITIFIILSLIYGAFIQIPNSTIAFTVIFLFYEFLIYVYSKKICTNVTILGLLAVSPIIYSAGSDLGIYKSYWIIPQNLLIFFLFNKINRTKILVNFSLLRISFLTIVLLSLNGLLSNNLYRSSKINDSNKSVDLTPFNHIRISYWSKLSILKQLMFVEQKWDFNIENKNILLGGESFLLINHLLFNNNNSFNNFYPFKSIHATINDPNSLIFILDQISNIMDIDKVTNIYNFSGHPVEGFLLGDSITFKKFKIIFDSELDGIQLFKIYKIVE